MRKAARIVLVCILAVQCVFWIVSGILMLDGAPHIVVPLLMIADGIAFGALVLLCKKRHLLIRIGAVAFLFVNLVLSVTDQLGVLDIVALILNAAALLCCLFLFIGGAED